MKFHMLFINSGKCSNLGDGEIIWRRGFPCSLDQGFGLSRTMDTGNTRVSFSVSTVRSGEFEAAGVGCVPRVCT